MADNVVVVYISKYNRECDAISTAGLKGVCMTTTECQGTGTTDGNCAASFGVCCVIR